MKNLKRNKTKMQKEIDNVKKKIEWLEKHQTELTSRQKEDTILNLNEINNMLRRFMLTCLAVNKY